VDPLNPLFAGVHNSNGKLLELLSVMQPVITDHQTAHPYCRQQNLPRFTDSNGREFAAGSSHSASPGYRRLLNSCCGNANWHSRAPPAMIYSLARRCETLQTRVSHLRESSEMVFLESPCQTISRCIAWFVFLEKMRCSQSLLPPALLHFITQNEYEARGTLPA